MNELRLHVERAVRPIRATSATKLEMREELLAHLVEIYEEERSHGADEPAAVARAKDRIGTPAELSAELDTTIARTERWGAAIEQHFGRRTAKSDVHYVLRISGWYAVFLLLVAAIVPLVLCIADLDGDSTKPLVDEFLHRTRFVIPILVWVQVNVTAMVYFELRLSTAQRRVHRALWAIAGGLTFGATSALMLWSLTGEATAAVDVVRLGPWLMLAALSPPALSAFAWLQAREGAKLTPWVEIELGE